MKNANVSKTENANVSKINFDKFAKELQNFSAKEKKERETIYVYPEEFSKKEINEEKGKKWRNSQRNQRNRFCNNILLYFKMKREDDLMKEISSFESFYHVTYRKIDYSLDSISQSKNDEKQNDLSLMLSIIKEILYVNKGIKK